ncbi:hypothetical protein [Bacillus sp. MUM 116]|nr:hypothetical protein [Bacillus sp. MUM 116]
MVNQKKEDQNEILKPDQQSLENSISDERLPEFDEIGTALNDI